jgi:transcriptional regulator GlxA family with amidase domain
MIQREIVYRIFCSPEGARLRGIAALGQQTNRIARAIAGLRANIAKPIRIGELAEDAGMGVSTFHHHFRMLTARSPLPYQKPLRLQAARARMLLDGVPRLRSAMRARASSIGLRRAPKSTQ